jgi:hypothetical protein
MYSSNKQRAATNCLFRWLLPLNSRGPQGILPGFYFLHCNPFRKGEKAEKKNKNLFFKKNIAFFTL